MGRRTINDDVACREPACGRERHDPPRLRPRHVMPPANCLRYESGTLLTGDFTGNGSNIRESGGRGRSMMASMAKASGGGGIVAGRGDVVGIDIVTDGRTDDDDNNNDGYRTRATTQR